MKPGKITHCSTHPQTPLTKSESDIFEYSNKLLIYPTEFFLQFIKFK